jgi:lipopolysaccharide export system permease protein
MAGFMLLLHGGVLLLGLAWLAQAAQQLGLCGPPAPAPAPWPCATPKIDPTT